LFKIYNSFIDTNLIHNFYINYLKLISSKIVIDNKIIEQVNSFNYLGNMISYEKELDIYNKLHKYLKITGILNNVFRPQKLLRKEE